MIKITLGLTFYEKAFDVKIVHIGQAVRAKAGQVGPQGGAGRDSLAALPAVRSCKYFVCGLLNLRS